MYRIFPMPLEKTVAPHTISLDDLIALTDEMAALVRAGVPLETGMANAARELSRKPAKLASAMSSRMQAGESLLHVLQTSPSIFPPAYVAVVEAGLCAGRLPAALEGLATSSRRAAELRRLTRASLLYPLCIALGAYALFVYSIVKIQPLVAAAYESMDRNQSSLNLMLANFGRIAFDWLPWIPVAVLAVVAVWWFKSTRATAREGRFASITPVGQVLRLGRIATFADLLALLVESSVPLAPAINLAASASGDRRLQAACQSLASNLDRGGNGMESIQPTESSNSSKVGLPPLLRWQLTGGGSRNALAESLRTTAEAYRRRAIRLDDWLRLYLPLGLLVGIGGASVLLYALTMFVPWFEMLQNIGAGHR
jgi:type II secretory pathway component PulF